MKPLKEPINVVEEEYHIESKVDLIIGATHLLVCLVFLIISSYINFEMWLIALICASSLFLFIIVWRLISRRHWDYLYDSVKRLPYELIPFVISMFVIVTALNYQGVSSEIAKLLNNSNTIFSYGLSSFLASNVINNIPMSILFSNFPTSLESVDYLRAIYATIIGSNIGAFLTPLGALAGIMFSNLTYKYGIKYGFRRFTKYGVMISIPTLLTALVFLMIIL
jgi:arsenical pump membrane protein